MKKCPYCFEEIKDEAIVCRYCRRELPGYEEEMNRRKIEPGSSVQIEGMNRQSEIIRQESPPLQDKPEIVPTPNDEEINIPSQPVRQVSSPQQVKHDDILPQIPIIEDMNKPTQTVAQVSPSRQDKHYDIPTKVPNPNYRKNMIVVIALIVILICVLVSPLCYLSIQKANSSASPIETNTAQTLEAINKTNVVSELNSTTMPNPTNTEEFTETPIPPTATATPLPTKTPTPDWMSPPFQRICKKDESMTDVQLEQYLKGFIGKKAVDWKGWIYEVSESGFNYTVLIGMDPPSEFWWSRDIEIVGVAQEQAMRLRKEQKVTFSGTIQEVGVFWGSICNPLTIENATILE